ncbi:deoxyuridine 5'-triphosphate nucleotidohydrolase [Paenibacillus sp. VTT E-133291]|nr:deoxyuridine 5'-triphosphate nucleotidohydrolase [Paenibacillus sp. VTT E-133291]
MNVKITLMPCASVPQYARPGDSGFDLVAQEDYVVEPGATVLVRTGIALELPEGYEVQVRPRSGVTLWTKLRVNLGTIDAGFRGEIGVIVDNIAQVEYDTERDYETNAVTAVEVAQSGSAGTLDGSYVLGYFPQGTYIIRKGERIAQAVIAPVSRANFVVVAELSETERGSGAFGHTGVNAE